MAVFGEKIDLTANLADELLHKVFSYLPLCDKFAVESVSRRFQRCILYLLKITPQPLTLRIYTVFPLRHPIVNQFPTPNFYESYAILNGIKVEFMLVALRALANKTKFNPIHIHDPQERFDGPKKADAIMSVLVDESQCLEKLISITIAGKCSQNILELFTANCPKLSIVKIAYRVQPLDGADRLSVPLDLALAFSNVALSQLDLLLTDYPHQQLLQLFKSLKPNTLQKLHIGFRFRKNEGMNLAQLANELYTSGWASLKEIHFKGAGIQLGEFIDSLPLLPCLTKCRIEPTGPGLFVNDMTSLFKSSINVTVRSSCLLRNVRGCKIISQIQKVQSVHSDLKANFVHNPFRHSDCALDLHLCLKSVFFIETVYPKLCANPHCADCHRFYPNVLLALAEKAGHLIDSHLEEYQLSRCRIGDVVEHLKLSRKGAEPVPIEADQTQDLVRIMFETAGQPVERFNVTVASGQCFSRSCVQCINVKFG